ncbi:sorbosone dehydrogenase family protein [uncultured Aquincola sp.]|uniref:PQQ-dependent sugar dehydrogenase n=1 Tax=uncultured Aquincola sp. TaxID=886556 RepID=UPI0032B2AD49
MVRSTLAARPLPALLAVAAVATAMALAGCGDTAQLRLQDGIGPNPQLPPPTQRLIPTVNVAEASAWPAGAAPTAAPGTRVTRFAEGLDHPRWLYVLPNGDVLVAETNAPPKPEDKSGGLKGWVMKKVMAKAGAGVPSANRITLLRDADGDGVADQRTVFAENLKSPFGMALVGQHFYVANADALLRFDYQPGALKLQGSGTQVTDLPGGRNHHWTKSLIASPDGRKLYVGVGSNSNVAEHGMAEEENRAAILEIDVATGAKRVYASGLRNPVGLAWQPDSQQLWVAVNERDEIGSDLVPDYMTSVKDGGFYGWPYSYYGQTVDERVQPPRPDLVAKAIKPDYALGAHTASLGLAWSAGNALPPAFAKGMFVGQHGSWNRQPRSGYRVIFVPFEGAQPSGQPVEVLTGFINADDKAQGRPVGVAIDKRGGLLVADDVGNIIWRVTADR